MGRWSIREGICKRDDPMENSVFGGFYQGSDGLVVEFHRIEYLFGLGVLWINPLAPINIKGHPYDSSLFPSKVPLLAIGCLPVNHDWKDKGSKRVGLIVKWTLELLPGQDLRVKG